MKVCMMPCPNVVLKKSNNFNFQYDTIGNSDSSNIEVEKTTVPFPQMEPAQVYVKTPNQSLLLCF